MDAPEQLRITLAPESPAERAAREAQEAAEKEAYTQLCLRAYLATQRREANWELVRDLLAALRRARQAPALREERDRV